MAFATLWKGFTALAIQSFTTAWKNGVYEEMRDEIDNFFPPFGEMVGKFLERNVEFVPKKAYRWVGEMEEIAETHEQTGWSGDLFRSIKEVYDVVDAESEVGKRRVKDVKVLEVVESIGEALEKRKEKME